MHDLSLHDSCDSYDNILAFVSFKQNLTFSFRKQRPCLEFCDTFQRENLIIVLLDIIQLANSD